MRLSCDPKAVRYSELGQNVPAIDPFSALPSAFYRIPYINWVYASTVSVSTDTVKRSLVIRFSKLAETVRAYRPSLPSQTQQKHGTGGDAMHVWKT